MDFVEFLLKFSLVLLSAKALGEAFAYARLPSVIGEVAAGLVIGPSVLGLVGPEDIFQILSMVGVLFLLFRVGMETDINRLIEVGGQSALVALTGVVLPFAGGYAAGRYLFGMETTTALFVGGALVATSIGITMRVLKDLGLQDSRLAQVVLGAAVLDDVLGVILLAVLLDFSVEGTVRLLPSLKTLAFVAAFLAAAPVLGPYLRAVILRLAAHSRTPGVLQILVVSFMLIISAFSHKLGAPEIIGAFAAGLALGGSTPFKRLRRENHGQAARSRALLEAETAPIAELFMPVFFVMVGVSIDLAVVDFGSPAFWGFSLLMTANAFLMKLLSGVWYRGDWRDKAAVGLAMAPRGEVGLVFAELGLVNHIFDAPTYASVVFIVAATTLAAPLALKWAAGQRPGPSTL